MKKFKRYYLDNMKSAVPNIFVIRNWFCGRQVFTDRAENVSVDWYQSVAQGLGTPVLKHHASKAISDYLWLLVYR